MHAGTNTYTLTEKHTQRNNNALEATYKHNALEATYEHVTQTDRAQKKKKKTHYRSSNVKIMKINQLSIPMPLI